MLFDNPEMRQAFTEMYGTDKEGAKFKIGQRVKFTTTLNDQPAEWTGKVEAVNFVAAQQYEYLIEGAFVLAWEEQLTEVI